EDHLLHVGLVGVYEARRPSDHLTEERVEDQARIQHQGEFQAAAGAAPAGLQQHAEHQGVAGQKHQRAEHDPQHAQAGTSEFPAEIAPDQLADKIAVAGERPEGRQGTTKCVLHVGSLQPAASACSRSRRRSPTSSMPTLRRTSESLMPRRARRSTGTEAWVITAGWLSRLSTPPSDSARVNSFVRAQKRLAASKPPLSTTETMPPEPDICRVASACCGCDSSPG